jgi:diaminopimelate epimerase
MFVSFTKMHGLGNDFVIVDLRDQNCEISKDQILTLGNRKTGVGCDQLIIMETPSHKDNDCLMRIYNGADGQEVEACGNATRCVGDIILKEKGVSPVRIETVAGILTCTGAENGMISVDMGIPKLDWVDIPLSKECDTLHLPLDGDPVGVNIGNPHCVFFLEANVEEYPVHETGPKIENDRLSPIASMSNL